MKRVYSIGRDPECDIILHDNQNITSRFHATLRIDQKNKITIIDQSTNGTYVNGMKISSGIEVPISRNDEVSFGHVESLDWGLIPDPKKKKCKIAIICIGCIIALMGITYLGYYLYNEQNIEHFPLESTSFPDSLATSILPEKNNEPVVKRMPVEKKTKTKPRPKQKPRQETEKPSADNGNKQTETIKDKNISNAIY